MFGLWVERPEDGWGLRGGKVERGAAFNELCEEIDGEEIGVNSSVRQASPGLDSIGEAVDPASVARGRHFLLPSRLAHQHHPKTNLNHG